jgi:hypothetical protein
MNAGGSAIVSAFDSGTEAFNGVVSAILPDEKTKLGNSIKALEKKSQELFVEVGKETSQHPDHAAALESESVSVALNSIKKLNVEIERMKQRIVEIDAVKTEKQSP